MIGDHRPSSCDGMSQLTCSCSRISDSVWSRTRWHRFQSGDREVVLASASWAGLGGRCEGFSDSVRSPLAQGFAPADAEKVGKSRMWSTFPHPGMHRPLCVNEQEGGVSRSVHQIICEMESWPRLLGLWAWHVLRWRAVLLQWCLWCSQVAHGQLVLGRSFWFILSLHGLMLVGRATENELCRHEELSLETQASNHSHLEDQGRSSVSSRLVWQLSDSVLKVIFKKVRWCGSVTQCLPSVY